jgi:ubiquinone/menaquinone biosynthesis C-methylase UbiE
VSIESDLKGLKGPNVCAKRLPHREVSQLSYCDFMAYLGVPLFQFGGLKIAEDLLRRCGLNDKSTVLEVGCGTGFMACRLAEERGSRIVGVDISSRMIELARERAKRQKVEDRVVFEVADACDLPFEDNTFDVVFTQFVTVFLDKNKALREYFRVVKHGGTIGVVEIFKDEKIPEYSLIQIEEAEEIMSRTTGFDFRLPTVSQWKGWFEDAGALTLQTAEHKKMTAKESWNFLKIVGLSPLLKIELRYFYHLLFNAGIRRKFLPTSRAKNILLRRKETARHTGILICLGKKPLEKYLVVSRGRSINL